MIEKRSQALDSMVSGLKSDSGSFIKEAELNEDAESFIHSYDYDPSRGVILAVNALGAGEYYGPNINGDHFPENSLLGQQDEVEAFKNPEESRGDKLIRYKTFENGHVFEHHQNDDPENACGDILKASWHPKMHRVELITLVEGNAADKVLKKIHDGKPVAVSMGTRVPWDLCNVCGNRAPTRKKYCEHLKHRMGEVTENGKKICAINTKPRFFDLSIVTVPADKTAYALRVIDEPINKEANDKTGENKKSDIDKEIHQYIDEDELESLSDYNPAEIVSTFVASGVEPKEAELQWVWMQHFDKEAGLNACRKRVKYKVDDDILKMADFDSSELISGEPNEDVVKEASDYIKVNSLFSETSKEAQQGVSPRSAPLPNVEGIENQAEWSALRGGAAITGGAVAGSIVKKAMEALKIGDSGTISKLLKSYPQLMFTLMSVLGISTLRSSTGGGASPEAAIGRR